MNRFIKIFFTCFSLSALIAQTSAPTFVPPAPKLAVKSYVLMDYDSGQVIAEHRSQESFEPASLTKMMTMYALDKDLEAGRIHLTDQVLISQKARQTPGSRMYLEEKSQVPLAEILKGIIIQSGNDASVAAAEHAAGDEKTFSQLMNFYAQKLSMSNSHFTNATGLPDPKHRSCAYDLALLSRALIKDFPKSYSVYSEKSFTYNNIEQHNRNRLLWENTFVDGIKTGQTDGAGYCLASSAKKDGMRLIAVILGAETEKLRSYESLRLLQYGFRFYQSHHLLEKNKSLAKERLWMGENKFIDIGSQEDIFIAIPTGSLKNLEVKLNIEPHLKAPVDQGEQVGTIEVYLDNKLYQQYPAVTLEEVPTANAFHRFQDNVKLTVTKWMQTTKTES